MPKYLFILLGDNGVYCAQKKKVTLWEKGNSLRHWNYDDKAESGDKYLNDIEQDMTESQIWVCLLVVCSVQKIYLSIIVSFAPCKGGIQRFSGKLQIPQVL